MLISNMLLVRGTCPICPTEIGDIFVKKIQDCVSIIVCYDLSQVVILGSRTMWYHFQGLSVLDLYTGKIRNRYFAIHEILFRHVRNWSYFHDFISGSGHCFGYSRIDYLGDLNNLVSFRRPICPLTKEKNSRTQSRHITGARVSFHQIIYDVKRHKNTGKRRNKISHKVVSKCIQNRTKMFTMPRSIVPCLFQNVRS